MLKYLMWILLVIGGFTLAWAVYEWLVPEPADLLPTRLSGRPDDARAGGFLDAAGANLDSPVLDGNEIELLVNGVEIFPAMLEAIEAAEESVNFLTYVYWTGDIARRMAGALTRAAERGVEVRVLLDAYGARLMDEELIEDLEAAGARVAFFHPLRWYHVRRLNNRTHRKVLVVDGRVGFTGGVGIAEEWEGDARREGEWRDDHFRVRGPVVRYLQGAFADNWRDATGEVLAGESMFPDLEDVGSSRILALTTSPRGDVSPIAFLYWLALHTATERVDISTPYFLPDDALLDAMRDASERGVRIRLLVPDEHNDSELVRVASVSRYRTLLEGGIEIHEYGTSMLHAKTVLVDDRWAIVGSANFDNRSFELNDEIVLLVEDSGFVARVRETYARDLEAARRITLEDVADRSWVDRVKSALALVFREQL